MSPAGGCAKKSENSTARHHVYGVCAALLALAKGKYRAEISAARCRSSRASAGLVGSHRLSSPRRRLAETMRRTHELLQIAETFGLDLVFVTVEM